MKVSEELRVKLLEEMDKLIEHLILKREIKDQPRLKEEILTYIDNTILLPYLKKKDDSDSINHNFFEENKERPYHASQE